MSVEEDLGWSVRDNYCSTLRQYVLRTFSPKGRLRRRDFFVTLLALMFLTDLGIHISAMVLALDDINLSNVRFMQPTVSECNDWWGAVNYYNVACLADVLDWMLLFFSPYTHYLILPWLSVFFDNYPMLGFPYGLVLFLWMAVVAYLLLCSCIRRLHDSGHRGWYFLLTYIPLANLYLLYLLLFVADRTPNRYGSDPRKPYEGQCE